MPFQDSWAICTKCGKKFVFRIEEQKRQAQQGREITPPEMCPDCAGTRSRSSTPAREQRRSAPAPRKPVVGPGPHDGEVKWFDLDKGYGFISQADGDDIFFHRTSVVEGEELDFPDGTLVSYCIEHTEKGPQAVDVKHRD
jgi:cold shock protein